MELADLMVAVEFLVCLLINILSVNTARETPHTTGAALSHTHTYRVEKLAHACLSGLFNAACVCWGQTQLTVFSKT